METDSVEAIKSFVVVGLGASFLPERSVADEIAHGTLVRVDVEGMSPLRRETAAVYRTGGHLNAAASGFLDLMEHPQAHAAR
jgi:DNA-binding transcriptional LysR family regulator